jgi:hypothetical protein
MFVISELLLPITSFKQAILILTVFVFPFAGYIAITSFTRQISVISLNDSRIVRGKRAFVYSFLAVVVIFIAYVVFFSVVLLYS